MSHKAGEIIIETLLPLPQLTPEERIGLMALSQRFEKNQELSSTERMSLAWLVYRVSNRSG